MSGIHIDEFYGDASCAITSLYSVFPRPITLLWLGEEGYLRYHDTIRQEAVDQAVLSGRCFAALLSRAPDLTSEPSQENLPASIQAHQATIIHQLEQALKSKSSITIQSAFVPLLEQMAR